MQENDSNDIISKVNKITLYNLEITNLETKRDSKRMGDIETVISKYFLIGVTYRTVCSKIFGANIQYFSKSLIPSK